jgi:hypothetical protein
MQRERRFCKFSSEHLQHSDNMADTRVCHMWETLVLPYLIEGPEAKYSNMSSRIMQYFKHIFYTECKMATWLQHEHEVFI